SDLDHKTEYDPDRSPQHEAIGRKDGYGDERPEIQDRARLGKEVGGRIHGDPRSGGCETGRDRTAQDPRAPPAPADQEAREDDPDGDDQRRGGRADQRQDDGAGADQLDKLSNRELDSRKPHSSDPGAGSRSRGLRMSGEDPIDRDAPAGEQRLGI